MTEPKWQWYAGDRDYDDYPIGPCETKQAAIDAAIEAGAYGWNDKNRNRICVDVIEGITWTADDIEIDSYRIIEELEDHQCADWLDSYGGKPLFDLSVADYDELTEKMTATFREWAKGKTLNCYDFKQTRNGETVDLPNPNPETPHPKDEDDA